MGRNGIRLLLALAAVAIGMAIAVPAAIGALPDRYVVRLPEPLQKYGLPEDSVALLPTVGAPVAAAALLATATAVPPAARSSEAAILPTAVLPVLEVAGETAVPPTATLEPSPTATATPTPSPTATPTPRPRPAAARLEGVRHQFQTWNNCGPATLAMALTYFGERLTQDQTAAVLKPDPEDRNVTPEEMAAYVQEQTPYDALARANGDLETLRQLLANQVPVIIELGIDPPGEFGWLGWYGHYLLVVAYDDDLQELRVYDSWFGTSEEPLLNADPDGRVLTYDDLAYYWPQFNRNYIPLYRPEQAALVAEITGADQGEQAMWEAALVQARQDSAADPEDAFAWFNLGTAYNALGAYQNAATAFDQARAIGLPWRMLWYQFGPYEAYYETGRYDDVLLLTGVTLKDRPYFEESFYYEGLALAALGREDEARQSLQKAAAFNPNFVPAAAALAELGG